MVGNAIAVFLGLLFILYGTLLLISPDSMHVAYGSYPRWQRTLERKTPLAIRRALRAWGPRVGGVTALALGVFICVAATLELIR
jgi:hypothetical protein